MNIKDIQSKIYEATIEVELIERISHSITVVVLLKKQKKAKIKEVVEKSIKKIILVRWK